MMKRKQFFLYAGLFLGGALFVLFCGGTGIEGPFPPLGDWRELGEVQIYTPDNLYEYINGQAESYLSYNFQELKTQSYEHPEGYSLTIDVYRHSDPANAFGIYSQEKPMEGNFLDIGTQGYYDQSILNLFMGATYVKMMCFGMESGAEREFLVELGRKIARRLDEEPGLPQVVTLFPEENKIPYSEKYISKNFMGYGFLHSAYVAEYVLDGEKRDLFIIETSGEGEARGMMNDYLEAKKLSPAAEGESEASRVFTDPYYRSRGKMHLRWKGAYLWGMLNSDSEAAEYYLEKVGAVLFPGN
jgi:hypothetical protein